MIEKPATGRSIITRTPRGLAIGIPSKRHWFVILFSCFWLCGWLMGELFAISSLMDAFSEPPFSFFILLWLIIWTFGGALVSYMVIWQVFGRELITIEGKVFTYQRMFLGFGRSRSFDIGEMKNIAIHTVSKKEKARLSPNSHTNAIEVPWGMQSGKIKFDYGLKTLYFASEVDKAEAAHLLQVLKDSPNFDEENFVVK